MGHPKRKLVFQLSIFRCELLVSGRVMSKSLWFQCQENLSRCGECLARSRSGLGVGGSMVYWFITQLMLEYWTALPAQSIHICTYIAQTYAVITVSILCHHKYNIHMLHIDLSIYNPYSHLVYMYPPCISSTSQGNSHGHPAVILSISEPRHSGYGLPGVSYHMYNKGKTGTSKTVGLSSDFPMSCGKKWILKMEVRIFLFSIGKIFILIFLGCIGCILVVTTDPRDPMVAFSFARPGRNFWPKSVLTGQLLFTKAMSCPYFGGE